MITYGGFDVSVVENRTSSRTAVVLAVSCKLWRGLNVDSKCGFSEDSKDSTLDGYGGFDVGFVETSSRIVIV